MKKTFLLTTLLMAAAAFSTNANAQYDDGRNKEILFKIHDIKANKDEDGLVKDCSFFVTFFNRTDHEIDSASLDLSWLDNTGNYIIEQANPTNEEEVASSEKKAKIKAQEKLVSTFVDVPNIYPYNQGTIPATLKSEKCFLLINDVQFKVTSCRLKNNGDNGPAMLSNSTNERNIESCSKLFKFVSPQDPQYYQEFKSISVAEQEQNKVNEQKYQLDNIESKYHNITSNLDSAQAILNDLK